MEHHWLGRWRKETVNQEMWTASRIQKWQENGFFLEPPERITAIQIP